MLLYVLLTEHESQATENTQKKYPVLWIEEGEGGER
jgi:hypothetical protein